MSDGLECATYSWPLVVKKVDSPLDCWYREPSNQWPLSLIKVYRRRLINTFSRCNTCCRNFPIVSIGHGVIGAQSLNATWWKKVGGPVSSLCITLPIKRNFSSLSTFCLFFFSLSLLSISLREKITRWKGRIAARSDVKCWEALEHCRVWTTMGSG